MLKKFLSIFIIASSLLIFSSSFSMDLKKSMERKNEVEINSEVKDLMEEMVTKVEESTPNLILSLKDLCTKELAQYYDQQLPQVTGKNVDELYLKLNRLPGNLNNLFLKQVLRYFKAHQYLSSQSLYRPSPPYPYPFSPVNCVAYSPDGDEFLSAFKNKRIIRWKREANGAFTHNQHDIIDAEVNRFIYNPNNTEVAAALFNNKIAICPRNPDGSFQFHRDEFDRQELDKHTDFVECMAYHADGDELISGSCDHTVCIWQRNCKGLLDFKQQLKQHKESVRCLRYRPGDNEFATGSWDKTVCIWQRNNNGLFTLQQTVLLDDPVMNLMYSHDGNELAVVGFGNKTISIWQRQKNGSFIFKQKLLIEYDCDDVINLTYSPNDSELTIISKKYCHHEWKRNADGIFSCMSTRKNFNSECLHGTAWPSCTVWWSPDFTEYAHNHLGYINFDINNFIAQFIEYHTYDFEFDDSIFQKNTNGLFISALAVVALINSKTVEELQGLNDSNVFNNLPLELQKLIQKKIDFKIKFLVQEKKEQKEFKEEKEGKESDKKKDQEQGKPQQLQLDQSRCSLEVNPPSPRASAENGCSKSATGSS
jgi:hypothetical protein